MAEFKTIISKLKVKTVYFMPGEHDAPLDRGTAFKELLGFAGHLPSTTTHALRDSEPVARG